MVAVSLQNLSFSAVSIIDSSPRYFRLEMQYVLKMFKRRQILGLEPDDADADAEEEEEEHDDTFITLPKLPEEKKAEGEDSTSGSKVGIQDEEYQKLEAGKKTFLSGAIPKIVYQQAISTLDTISASAEVVKADPKLVQEEKDRPKRSGLSFRVLFLKTIDEFIDVGGGALHAAVSEAIETSIRMDYDGDSAATALLCERPLQKVLADYTAEAEAEEEDEGMEKRGGRGWGKVNII